MLRAVVLGAMALLVAGFVAVTYVALRPQGAAEVPQKTVSVLAAAKPVRAGMLLQPADLASHDVAEASLAAGIVRDTPDARAAMVGAMLRRSLDTGSTIGAGDVLRPGDRGFLAAVLAPGTRAVSVAVDAVSGEAGLIWPGDRVDVLLTQTIDAADQSPAHHVSGEVVLGNVRVIAVDQQLVQGGQATGMLDGKTPASRTITLEVSAHDASRVAVATRLGTLQVVVRSAEPAVADASPPVAAPAPVPLPPTPHAIKTASESDQIWGGDVSQALRGGSSSSVAVRVFQGSRQVEEYKF